MQKLFSLAISFLICLVFGVADVWPWFALSFVLLSLPDIRESVWEIPIGAMAISVLVIFLGDYTAVLMSVLLISTSVIFAISIPRKLIIFYPLAAIALFLFPADESIVYTMAAALWCACRGAFFFKHEAPMPVVFEDKSYPPV